MTVADFLTNLIARHASAGSTCAHRRIVYVLLPYTVRVRCRYARLGLALGFILEFLMSIAVAAVCVQQNDESCTREQHAKLVLLVRAFFSLVVCLVVCGNVCVCCACVCVCVYVCACFNE